MLRFIKNKSLIFLLFCSASFGASKEDTLCSEHPFSKASLRHREHKGLGFNQGYTTLSCFLSPSTRRLFHPFLDARLHTFNSGYIASNLGVGARFCTFDDNLIFGMNGYYDFRNYKNLSSHQGSLGFEILSKWVDFRINGYKPFSRKVTESSSAFYKFQGNSAILSQHIRYSLPLADAEIGFTLPDPFKQVNLYLAFGAYYLFKTDAQNHAIGDTFGGKARLKASPREYISFDVEYTKDALYGSRVNGAISFNVKLGQTKKIRKSKVSCKGYIDALNRRTQETVHQEIILFYSEDYKYKHSRSNTNGKNGRNKNKTYHFIFVNNKDYPGFGPGSGSGTADDPYTTLSLAQNNSAPDDIIYVFYGKGTSSGYDEGFTYKTEQYLTSSAVDLSLDKIVIPASTPGLFPFLDNGKNPTSPTLLASSTDVVSLIGFNVSIKNYELNTPPDVVSFASTGAILLSNQIYGAFTEPSFKGNCVNIDNPTYEIEVANNIFVDGAFIASGGNSNSYCTVENNTFKTNNLSSGISLSMFNPLANIKGNNLISNQTSSSFGIFAQSNSSNPLSIKNNTVSSGYGTQIRINLNSNATATISNNTLTNGNIGLSLEAQGGGTGSITENAINSYSLAIAIENSFENSATFKVLNNTLSTKSPGVTHAGILVESSGNGVFTISDNTITLGDPAITGISIDLNNTQFIKNELTITSNKIFNTNSALSVNSEGLSRGIISVNGNEFGGKEANVQIYSNSTQSTCVNFSGNVLGTVNFSNINNGAYTVFSVDGTKQGLILENIFNGSPPITASSSVNFATPSTGCAPFYAVFVNNTAPLTGANGSFANPYPTLALAQANSNPGDLIYVYAGDGTTKGYDTGFILKPNQTIAGSGATFNYNGTVIVGSGAAPIITKTNGSALISTQGSGSIIGLTLSDSIAQDLVLFSSSSPSTLSISQSTFIVNSQDSSALDVAGAIGETSINLSNNTFEAKNQISDLIYVAPSITSPVYLTVDSNIVEGAPILNNCKFLPNQGSIAYINNTITTVNPGNFYLGSQSATSMIANFSNNLIPNAQEAVSIYPPSSKNETSIIQNLAPQSNLYFNGATGKSLCFKDFSSNTADAFYFPSGSTYNFQSYTSLQGLTQNNTGQFAPQGTFTFNPSCP